MGLESFQKHVASSAQHLLSLAPSEILLLHHNDSDGLTSGAILSKAFERLQLKVRRICLEKPYPEVVEYLLTDPDIAYGTVVVIADFASGMLSTFANANRSKLPIIVLDHHTVAPFRADEILVVNPRQYEVSGDAEASAGMVCAFFASHLGEFNDDLFKLGVIGAGGDFQISAAHQATGLNAIGLERAIACGGVTKSGENLTIAWNDDDCTTRDLGLLVRDIDALGAYGYLNGGTDVAIKGLLEGFDQRYVSSATIIGEQFEQERDSFLKSSKIHNLHKFSWFTLTPSFSKFGVKSVGLLCEQLLAKGVVPPAQFVVGFQSLNSAVPGLAVKLNPAVKISVRAGPELYNSITKGEIQSVASLLSNVTAKCSGFIDACHKYAGAATIPVAAKQLTESVPLDQIENVHRFIREVERELKN